MSLLTQAMTTCTMLVETTTADGYGGQTTTWADGDSFSAAITLNNQVEILRAQADRVYSAYTVTTTKDVVLSYHDVFRRESDGKVFQVTSDGEDKYTPASAGLDMRQVTANEWSVP